MCSSAGGHLVGKTFYYTHAHTLYDAMVNGVTRNITE